MINEIKFYYDEYSPSLNKGTFIKCPFCAEQNTVYHFSWSGFKCKICNKYSHKHEWTISRHHYETNQNSNN